MIARMSYKVCFSFLFSFVMTGASFAQVKKEPLITGTFTNVSLDSLMKMVAEKSGFHLYYDVSQFDSAAVTLSVTNKPLGYVLRMAFAGKGIGFSIDNSNNVFISKGLLVQTELNRKFFTATAADVKDTSDYLTNYTKLSGKSSSEDTLYAIGEAGGNSTSQEVTIAGYVRDIKSDEPVIGASVYIDDTKTGAVTDQYGYFSIHTNKGKHILYVQSIGVRDTKRQLLIQSDGKLTIAVQSQVTSLKNVTVSSEKMNNVKSTQMGLQRLDINTVKQVPVAFGEADVLRVVLTLPGVKSVGEASTGLNVRGGSADQNLILFNGATIYNPSHFFGLFSAFNPEVVKDVELYKASVPAQYGGRLSSVLDINSREGNKKTLAGTAGIGLLTSRLTLEGPIKKEKASFIVGGRTTYAGWLLNLLPDQYKNSRARFYDLNAVMNYELDKKNTVYVTGYWSDDRFNLNSDTTYNYGNRNLSARWKHIFSNRLTMLATAGYDSYYYNIQSTKEPVNAYHLHFDVNQWYARLNFTHNLSSQHTFQYGLSSILYKLHPGNYEPQGKESQVRPDQMQAEQGLESAIYFSDKYNVNPDLSFEGGVRFSTFSFMGPYSANTYAPNEPKTEETITGTNVFGSGHFIKNIWTT